MFGKLFGVLKTFMDILEQEVLAAGGDANMLERLGKKSLRPAIQQFAQAIVREARGLTNSFRAMITSGRYNAIYGYAEHPEDIKGQTYHEVVNEVELSHPNQRVTNVQICERFGDKMASLLELLQYGIDHPDAQREFPIAIVWKDGVGQFWYAFLGRDGSRRDLCVSQGDPNDGWSDDFRFLVRK